VFSLQQRAIGELMMVRPESGARYCLSYPEFVKKMNDPKFQQHFTPLVKLLEELNPAEDCRWKRLLATSKALRNSEESCKELLQLPQG
jgi:hypothetical protein